MKKSIFILIFGLLTLTNFTFANNLPDSSKKVENVASGKNSDNKAAQLQAAFEHFNADLTVIQVRFQHDPIKEEHFSQKAYQEYQQKVKSILSPEQEKSYQAKLNNR
jgi:hypothetical protein